MAKIEAEFEFEGTYEPPSCLTGFIDTGSDVSHNYFRARKTALEMLRDRGYSVPNEDIELTLQQFRDRYGDETVNCDELRVRAAHTDDPNNKIMVHFFEPGTLKVERIRLLLNIRLQEEALRSLVLVLEDKMTKQAREALELFPWKIEIFKMPELLVNITKHELKPKHQLLTADEKQRLLEKYHMQENQLPKMLVTDAIARYYAYERGTVLKVVSDGEATESAETQESYRIVW